LHSEHSGKNIKRQSNKAIVSPKSTEEINKNFDAMIKAKSESFKGYDDNESEGPKRHVTGKLQPESDEEEEQEEGVESEEDEE